MRTHLKMLALAVIAGGTMFAQVRVSVGIGVGGYDPGYYPPPVYEQYRPVCPGPDYSWVDGYWAPQHGRSIWIAGFWRRPYVSNYRMGPRYVEPRYYNSYRDHDRGYDRGRDRDYDRRRDYRGGERFNDRHDRRDDRRDDHRDRDYRNNYRR